MSEADERALVAQILSSYLSNNTVAPADLPSVIESVKKAFAGPSETMPTSDSDSKSWEPAVTIRKSVTPEAVTCLVCGKKFKSLKRHLQTAHQLAPRRISRRFQTKEELSSRCAVVCRASIRPSKVAWTRPQGRDESLGQEGGREASYQEGRLPRLDALPFIR